MATPPYHLRTNKAVDRHLFIDLLKHVIPPSISSDYRYYSFGGPYLEDFSLIHSTFPEMETVSLEMDQEVFKRQNFHNNSSKCQLKQMSVDDFLLGFSADKRAIFWLDFTSLSPKHLDTYMALLPQLPQGSIVRITLAVQPNLHVNSTDSLGNKSVKDGNDKEANFRKKYSDYLSGSSNDLDLDPLEFSKTVQKMVAIAAQKALPNSGIGLFVLPICGFYYKDGAGIFTHTSIISHTDSKDTDVSFWEKWKYFKNSWSGEIHKLDMPFLSTKERLKIQHLLPCGAGVDSILSALGYEIEKENNLELIQQYAEFYREYPHFIKAAI